MSLHINPNDPKYKKAAAEILRRHNIGAPEANITTAVRDFLTVSGLVKADEIEQENPPAQGSRRAVDLTALDTFIEFKRRIGTTGGFNPDPHNVDQIDDYLAQSEKPGRVRMGILTDGKYWLLRWPNAGSARTVPPYAFTFEDPDRWITLYEWLRDHALSVEENKQPSRPTIAEHFGPNSLTYQHDIATLKALYGDYAGSTIKVKRQLWQNLLTAALGEIAADPAQMDDLFVRHTYLEQASLAAPDPAVRRYPWLNVAVSEAGQAAAPDRVEQLERLRHGRYPGTVTTTSRELCKPRREPSAEQEMEDLVGRLIGGN